MIGFNVLLAFVIKALVFSTPGTTMDIHIHAGTGDLEEVRSILDASEQPEKIVNAFDEAGMTPLMLAAKSPDADPGMVRLLLDRGAQVRAVSDGSFDDGRPVLSFALHGGDPAKVALLLERGADLHYRYHGGYDAVIDAVHGRDITRAPRLMELLGLLVDSGASVLGRTEYCESGIRVASHLGRFDAVGLLLEAGADEKELGWSPLMHALALGTLEDVRAALNAGSSLTARDSWKRTPWLLAIQTGDIHKARLLLDHGADIEARGHFGKPPLFYAIGNGRPEMLRWLLDLNMDPEQADESGTTALMQAAEYGDAAAIGLLLEYGAEVDGGKAEPAPEYAAKMQKMWSGMGIDAEQLPELQQEEETALSNAGSREAALRLLAAGADPARLGREARRMILGFSAEPTEEYRLVSPDDFLRDRYRRFGRTNPEEIRAPFWEAMVRSGGNAWLASQAFKGSVPEPEQPVWCADRFGQSLTLLPDGRMVEIGGEHEDWYDPDFCIYNDVIVHDGKGGIRIFAYPEAEFPPTDFHTATLVGRYIYIIGSLGYPDARRYGETPLFRLHLDDFHVEAVKTTGENPGWISRHHASLEDGTRIHVKGGNLSVLQKGEEQQIPSRQDFILDLTRLNWSKVVGNQGK